jgi:hypothetical protein
VETNQTFTFICRGERASSHYVDVQIMSAEDARDHALRLLDEHHSANIVEVWCEPNLVERVERSARASSEIPAG